MSDHGRVNRRIGKTLLRLGSMSAKDVTDVIHAQLTGDDRQFGRIAIERGFVSEHDLWTAIEQDGHPTPSGGETNVTESSP